MSSPSFNATIDLRLKPSFRAVRLVYALHLAAIALAFIAAPGRWPGLLLILLLAISWQRLRRPAAAGFGPRAIHRLVWHGERPAWRIETADGLAEDAALLPSSVVWPNLIVLNFRLKSGQKRTRALLGDETDVESLRRLRARLLSGASPVAN